MKTISQVAELTGISTRTLQYYDEIDLLKPSSLTPSGYRLYDDKALQKLQQILFFKELDFKLKEIKNILDDPEYDKLEAYKNQKKLLIIKKNRMDKLIGLLNRLEKGEQCMSFKEFDLSEYIETLENFKTQHTDDVIEHWGSIENFEQFIQKVREDETKLAPMAIKEFGSIEKYTEAMKYNMEHFSEIMEQSKTLTENSESIVQKNDALFKRLVSDLGKDPASEEIQSVVQKIIEFTEQTTPGSGLGKGYWDVVIDSYTGDLGRKITDTKYGTGASDYISKAFRYHFHK